MMLSVGLINKGHKKGGKAKSYGIKKQMASVAFLAIV